MINHKAMQERLIRLGFERTLSSESGCWVNRINRMVVYRGTYSPEKKGTANYTLCLDDKREFAFTESEFETAYQKLLR